LKLLAFFRFLNFSKLRLQNAPIAPNISSQKASFKPQSSLTQYLSHPLTRGSSVSFLKRHSFTLKIKNEYDIQKASSVKVENSSLPPF